MVARKIYDSTVRDRLPRRWGMFAGVGARDVGFLDIQTRKDSYKRGLIAAIREHVADKDVTLVGFGRGVSTVHILRSGASHVTAIDAAGEMIETGKETLRANGADLSRTTIVHGVVGDAIEVYGDDVGASIPVEDVANSDVLIMDCEGAELSILRRLMALQGRPETIIVETHPERGVLTEDVLEVLDELDYRVSVREYEPGVEDKVVAVGELSNI